MINIDLIKFILKTGLVTLLLVGGIYMLVMSRVKLESVFSNVFNLRDLEITTGNIVFLKIVGSIFTLLSLFLLWQFFIYSPGGASS
ncbi:hypothetical protein [Ruficoccus sp. ZRK36]|uniref:hypothetical protein n=1 Tax=Ruficoccus sp. ZRK36 TaxID=2866311 RepID=UPI001C736B29|nr:hypothetical protein [Ruficoccus sp. ZRK36]QYY36589.1 hypothetical protein K0V07_03745 [Ruficoccus sp. ZRK36]